ncbi:class I SAM-dependent methyltransferase [Telmatospirillum siberiense]|uniref:Methyltransferase n=1 Tax=Telmatospirillum siberiense TaxID=382514 RepID=A0A2N3PMR8_9PROT|nr:class I SAM-dependent methyltransferase [Telmatospirillum siberiense]PKU21698.1 methyltransferase [Telmatospirillum siberiense]
MRGFSNKAIIPLLMAASLSFPAAGADETPDVQLKAVIDGPQRGTANRARDVYRHPYETLRFFGIREDQTVVEIEPSGGWWTEILAPYLRDHGTYYAAGPERQTTSAEQQTYRRQFEKKLADAPNLYDKVVVTEFGPHAHDIAPPESADLVLTFRNIHNWLADGSADSAFQSFFRALRHGGILGVEEHRAAGDQPQDPLAKSGYVREDVVIALAEAAGFKLAGRSDINANPKDTKDYPAGVWTLPPALRLKDQDRERYLAIGESDRATLKFIKP